MGTPGAYRVALLADASSTGDVEVLAFRNPAESLPPTTTKQLPAVAAGLPPATGTTAAALPATPAEAAQAAATQKQPLPQMPRPAPNISAAIQSEPIQTPASAPDDRDD
jgi:hypothetical protein